MHAVLFGDVGLLHPLFSAGLMIVFSYICLCCVKVVSVVKGASSLIWLYIFSFD
jgi:hypothetical protein